MAMSPEGDDGSDSNDDDGQKMMAEVISSVLLFLLIFGMSATVDAHNMIDQLRNKFAICTGLGMQFLIMPFLGFVTVKLLDGQGMNMAMGITLLIVTSSPGGSYSNWWCSLFNADLTLSVAMTALSTLLSIVFLPANLVLYTHAAYGADDVLDSVNFGKLFISLGIVIAAIFLGLGASLAFSGQQKFNRMANRVGSFAGVILVVFSLLVSMNSKEKDSKLWGQSWSFYVGVSMPCIMGLILANLISFFIRGRQQDGGGYNYRLDKPQVVTISVECCYQNVGIATSAAIAMFPDSETRGQALCVPLFYGILEAVLLALYCLLAWKLGWTRAPADEKLCVILAKTYEVVENNNNNNDDTTQIIKSSDPNNDIIIELPQDIEHATKEDYIDHDTTTTTPKSAADDTSSGWRIWKRRSSNNSNNNNSQREILNNKRSSKASKKALLCTSPFKKNSENMPSSELTIATANTVYTSRSRNKSEDWLIAPKNNADEK
mmetsp:Transcript_3158/g.3029  ORF Transcript_3158/g.3029 Transcript_3158/m.3029 type:complete len:490 (-) Transcript_3158:59-1528(-)|eukprot:CAMPEP_0197833220 /NCGR_PEP_ID=MMETSP1437-20131217/18215_1 /TAXON_ID=49252 ORGANISM="Eucampia antarctica, Strain CCMP1452" /NCGR_SAMPLE_ID=MMETSP1437 /ASSEMBLY_ACC=CAM_ASM_001096 /LENGTH=489 /DNA_ID=CAMNT_0043437139 /DNA_START=158 /DNA_END=1627 /DNA_ORIENTATION=-